MTGSHEQGSDRVPLSLWEETFRPDPAVARTIRQRVRRLLGDWKIPGTSAEDTVLVVQEMVSNVVDHARTPFRLAAQLCGPAVKVCIRDYSAAPISPRAHDTGASRRRGVQLIAAMSENWGCQTEEPGKTVWAAIPV
ncbi:ATP-binding protein [Cryptosporangium sp. NPDC048952]|uniref:ATP-binding protein n=1 Tax=Cryptosporangium sp. NPDC048952 TaxID=3363961 RepID=UPI003717F2EE